MYVSKQMIERLLENEARQVTSRLIGNGFSPDQADTL